MSDFQRYAIYYLPDDPDLAAFGSSWLGWDVVGGTAVAQPDVAGIGRITETPRKYGFHGTLKPPFRLAESSSRVALERDVAALAARLAPVRLDGLRLAALGSFLALVPTGDTSALDRLAFACVQALDGHRRPPELAELARRRSGGLTERQDMLLRQWGYPYVAEEFRFHLTLSGKLAPDEVAPLTATLETRLPPLPAPFNVGSIALLGEAGDGMFRQIQRYALTG